MHYQTTLAGITSQQLVGFFQGWPTSPDPETLWLILERSDFFVLAVNDEKQGMNYIPLS